MKILDSLVEMVQLVHGLARKVARHDRDLAQQMARQGYSSLFAFLVERYHMSESTAVKRIGAARLACRFPVLFTMVARGEIHLSGIHCIQAHLTPENYESVLAEAKHKTMRQLEELVARLAPKPDVPTTLHKLPRRPVRVQSSRLRLRLRLRLRRRSRAKLPFHPPTHRFRHGATLTPRRSPRVATGSRSRLTKVRATSSATPGPTGPPVPQRGRGRDPRTRVRRAVGPDPQAQNGHHCQAASPAVAGT